MNTLTEKLGASPVLQDGFNSLNIGSPAFSIYNVNMNLTYEYRVEPSTAQSERMLDWLETCRRLYNYALKERKDWLNSRKSAVNACSIRSEYIISADAPRPNYAIQCRHLTRRRAESAQYKDVQVHVLQQTLNRLEQAFVSMWEQGHGFPRFKKVGQLRSFVFPQMGIQPFQSGHLKLPKIGRVKVRESRPVPEGAVIKQVRVLRRASGWYALLSLEIDVPQPNIEPAGHPVGIDVGLESFLTTSEGEHIEPPQFFRKAQGKLKSLQRRLKRKKDGSSRKTKLRQQVARQHERIVNQRRDWHRKLAHHLCDKAGMVFAEDLNLKGLNRGMFSQSFADSAFGAFLSTLKWICHKRGVHFAKVDAAYSSQTCPQCSTRTGKKPLGLRVHDCSECRYVTHRDVAAAQVVCQRGIAALGQSVKQLVEGKVNGLP